MTNTVARSERVTTEVPLLTCSRCGSEFEPLDDLPNEEGSEVLCSECRGGEAPSRRRQKRRRITVECAACGEKARISFEPREGRPVYCKRCFKKQQQESQTAEPEEEDIRIPSSVDLYMRNNRWTRWVRGHGRRNGAQNGFRPGMAWEGPIERPPLPRRGLGSAGTYD